MSIVGVGGSNPTPFNTPFEMTDKQIDDLLHGAMKKMEKTVHNVLLCHAPPFETLDTVNGQHVGSASIRRHMKSFDLVCCAHVHEQRGVMDIDGVKMVNPGAGNGRLLCDAPLRHRGKGHQGRTADRLDSSSSRYEARIGSP